LVAGVVVCAEGDGWGATPSLEKKRFAKRDKWHYAECFPRACVDTVSIDQLPGNWFTAPFPQRFSFEQRVARSRRQW
jgi:hypothetical protein